MSLVDQIIQDAAGTDTPLTSVLRKCLILAFELDHDELKAWVTGELDGFASTDQLPPHRTFAITAKGLLLGGFGAEIRDQPLPSFVLDEPYRWWATTAYANQGVAAYEALVAKDPTGNATVYWPADLVAKYQTKFFAGYALNRAWQVLPIPAIGAMLDTVRTKVLQFALELRKHGLAEPMVKNTSAKEALPVIHQIFQTVIMGGTNVVGATAGQSINVANQQTVIAGDFNSLAARLNAAAVPGDQIAELRKILVNDEAKAQDTRQPTPKIKGWIATAAGYVAKEGGKAAVDLAKASISAAISSYLGLPAA